MLPGETILAQTGYGKAMGIKMAIPTNIKEAWILDKGKSLTYNGLYEYSFNKKAHRNGSQRSIAPCVFIYVMKL